MTAHETSAQEQLDTARELWDQFKAAYQDLGRSLRASDDERHAFEATRVEAYQPGFDPGFDWGMGISAEEWFDEIERVLLQQMSRNSQEHWLERLRRNGYVKHY